MQVKTTDEAALPQPTVNPSPAGRVEPPASVHTNNFSDLLRQLGISLVVSTYQAGKVIFLRPEGDHLNTHFRAFDKPMGLAYLAFFSRTYVFRSSM